jgi:hypothetical protein
MKFPRIHAPTPLFLVALLAYGLLIPFTGFYWDDWPFAWIARFLGPREFLPAFAPFRPFLGPIFLATTGLLPPNPILWQAFGVLVRFAAALSAWFALDSVWPTRKRETLLAALLFLVFPGYSQQWVALTHINQELIPLVFYLLSFGLTARALRNPKRYLPLTLAALLLHLCGLFPTEYFFGLEIFRFFFLWAILAESDANVVRNDIPQPCNSAGYHPAPRRFLQTLKHWWPYLLVWVADAGWLVYYYKFGAYASYAITAGENAVTTAATFANFFAALGEAVYKAGFLAWVQVFSHLAKTFPGASAIAAIALIIFTFALLIFVERLTWNVERSTQYAIRNTPSITWLLLGLLGILAGRLPSWAAGLPLTLQSSYDRFMVSMALGAALFVAGLVGLIRNKRARVIVASALIALAVGQQFLNANIFRRDWEGQRAIYWQFAWRIPALEPGTVIFTHQMPLDYETDLSMTAPLNWIYAPDFARGDDLPFVLLYPEKRLGGASLPDLEPDTLIKIPYRTVTFRGSPGKSITVYVPQNGCLRVLDPVYANAEVVDRQPRWLTMTIPLSDLSLIRADAPAPDMPASLFGREPAHAWCYYFEKAELARQRGDWAEVAALGADATQLGFAPEEAAEWLPFIEGYARTNNADEAARLSRKVIAADAHLRNGVCQVWARLRSEAGAPAPSQAGSEEMLVELGCVPASR